MHVSLRVGQCCIMAIELMINFVLIKGPAGLFSGLDWASFQQARKILRDPGQHRYNATECIVIELRSYQHA